MLTTAHRRPGQPILHPDAIPQAEGDIHEFLSRYPGDVRAANAGIEKEIDLYWLEKRFQRRVKGLAGAGRFAAH